jgi:hypothetical protein
LSKLAKLRAKTDNDLVWIITNAVELGMGLVSAKSADGPLRARAADLYAHASILLTKVEDNGGRRRLEDKLERLRGALKG